MGRLPSGRFQVCAADVTDRILVFEATSALPQS